MPDLLTKPQDETLTVPPMFADLEKWIRAAYKRAPVQLTVEHAGVDHVTISWTDTHGAAVTVMTSREINGPCRRQFAVLARLPWESLPRLIKVCDFTEHNWNGAMVELMSYLMSEGCYGGPDQKPLAES